MQINNSDIYFPFSIFIFNDLRKNIDFWAIKACRNINLDAIGHENLSLL